IVEYASADDCLADHREIDLLFLDIELNSPGDDLDGMALARQIRERVSAAQPVIIFVTGYERYVFDAFDVGAFQYLLKPVDEEKFAQ
ncbi:MAG TPA: DNA-binding response regulator, partial [Lachnospiraceae bacterium]|nr:DNA-binding response regulator [Lachnospiraceae bacterium]